MNDTFFSSKDVIELYNALNQVQISIWIDGGWGVDALLGEQTRAHKDVDTGPVRIRVRLMHLQN